MAALAACWFILLAVGSAFDGSLATAMTETFRAAVPGIEFVLPIVGLLYATVVIFKRLPKAYALATSQPVAEVAFTIPQRVPTRALETEQAL